MLVLPSSDFSAPTTSVPEFTILLRVATAFLICSRVGFFSITTGFSRGLAIISISSSTATAASVCGCATLLPVAAEAGTAGFSGATGGLLSALLTCASGVTGRGFDLGCSFLGMNNLMIVATKLTTAIIKLAVTCHPRLRKLRPAVLPDAPPTGPEGFLGHFRPAASHKDSDAETIPKGMTTKVRMVDTSTPDAREIAIPWKMGSKKMTEEANTKAKAVIRIGRVRVLQALMTASSTGTPFCTSWIEKSTRRIEFRTIIPASAIHPIMDVAVNSPPKPRAKKIACTGIIPISVKGIGDMINAGMRKLPNSHTTRI